MRLVLISLLGLAVPTGVYASEQCLSPCGVTLTGSEDCEGFGRAEDRCLDLLARVKPVPSLWNPQGAQWSRSRLCQTMRGWRLKRRLEKSWYLTRKRPDGGTWTQEVNGSCQILEGWMEIQRAEWFESSLCHEYAHALEARIDGLLGYDPRPGVAEEHRDWKTRGISEALRLFRESLPSAR